MSPARRIGIYNRWLASLGGGEHYSLAVAEELSRTHDVTVISRVPVDKAAAGQRFGLDLTAVRFLIVPEDTAAPAAGLSEGYDLFLNASHNDFTPCLARRGVLVVYFPTRPGPEPAATRLHRWMKVAARRLLKVPDYQWGLYWTEPGAGALRRITGPDVRIAMPASSAPYRVRLEIASADGRDHRVAIHVGGVATATVDLLSSGEPALVELQAPGDGAALTVHADEASDGEEQTRLVMRGPFCDLAGNRVYHRVFEQWRPALGRSLQVVPPPPQPVLPALPSYQAIWAISDYSREWIRRYWGAESRTLYPPVDTRPPAATQKRNLILSVGRFYAGHHNKKHGAMIETFGRMVREGLAGWELHLVGGTMHGAVHEDYLAGLRRQAQGLPVVIHADAGRDELAGLYAGCAIYWHATGLGEDEDSAPEKQEHFGITTVEAMAAGCVPVVIARGGQREIIEHGRDGMLWETPEQLRTMTWQLVRDPALREALGSAAMLSCQRYSRERFRLRLHEMAATAMEGLA